MGVDLVDYELVEQQMDHVQIGQGDFDIIVRNYVLE